MLSTFDSASVSLPPLPSPSLSLPCYPSFPPYPLLPSLLSLSLSLSQSPIPRPWTSASLLTVKFLLFLSLCRSVCERESNPRTRPAYCMWSPYMLIACEVHICLLHVKSIYSYSHSSALRLVHYGYGSKWLCQAARLESGVLVLLHVKSPYSSAYSSALRLVHRSKRGRV